jgi:hypothetical protein
LVPRGWAVLPGSATPGLTDPVERFAAGTGRLDTLATDCAHMPMGPIDALGRRDVFVWIAERTARTDESPPRPATFGPDSGRGDGDLFDCARLVNNRQRLFLRWIPFTEQHRSFYIAVAIGRDATAARRAEVWMMLNSLVVESRPDMR